MYDVFWLSGYKGTKDLRENGYFFKYYNYPDGDSKVHAKNIVDLIMARPVRYKTFTSPDLGESMGWLTPEYFCPSMDPQKQDEETHIEPEEAYGFIADFCADNRLWWDDTTTSHYELDEIKKTKLGKALYERKCFLSQPLDGADQDEASAFERDAGRKPEDASAPAGKPYKQMGKLSYLVPTLIGQPGQKTQLPGQVYYITADKIGQNQPYVFVLPIANTGKSVTPEKASKPSLGSANGYASCVLYWGTRQAAQNVIDNLSGEIANFGKYSNIFVSYCRADQNGYFKVKTNIGDAYIRASKLNEDLDADGLKEAEDEKPAKKKKYKANRMHDVESFVETLLTRDI